MRGIGELADLIRVIFRCNLPQRMQAAHKAKCLRQHAVKLA